MGLAPFNHKRFYRVLKAYLLLLPKAPKRVASTRVHDGVVAVMVSNRRRCSDGFEIGCDNGDVVTGVFLKDCCDREIISLRAWSSRGLPGEPVRDMLVKGVEARFGNAKVGAGVELEFLRMKWTPSTESRKVAKGQMTNLEVGGSSQANGIKVP